MIVELTSLAARDAAAAAVAYELEVPGLGSRFDVELDRVVGRVGDNPLQFPMVEADVRRALLKIFPFSVFFLYWLIACESSRSSISTSTPTAGSRGVDAALRGLMRGTSGAPLHHSARSSTSTCSSATRHA